MNTIRIPKPSKKFIAIVSAIAIVLLAPLIVYLVQQQQEVRQRATTLWFVSQSATAVCSATGKATISISFTNSESIKDIIVIATDEQTGRTLNLGTVKHGETKTGEITTEQTLLSDGTVTFALQWANGSPGTDSRTALYSGIQTCAVSQPTPTAPICQATEGTCTWEPNENATAYKVVIKETATDEVIKSETVQHPTAKSIFPMNPSKTYQCVVTPINSCGNGKANISSEKSCLVPTPTPWCPVEKNVASCTWDMLPGADSYNVIVIEQDSGTTIKSETVQSPTNRLVFSTTPGKTYICKVTAANACGTNTPTESEPKTCSVPTPTLPIPSPTPTVPPTPTTPLPPTATTIPSPTPTRAPTPTRPPTPTRAPTPTRPPLPTNPPQQPPQQSSGGRTVIVQQPPAQQTATGSAVPSPTRVVVAQKSPQPTIASVGDANTTMILSIGMALLTIIGVALFFAF